MAIGSVHIIIYFYKIYLNSNLDINDVPIDWLFINDITYYSKKKISIMVCFIF